MLTTRDGEMERSDAISTFLNVYLDCVWIKEEEAAAAAAAAAAAIRDDQAESILADHSQDWWNLCHLLRRVFRSHRFKNVHVEVLYQRYFLRMNQSNLTSLLALLIVTAVVFSVLNYTLGGDHGLLQGVIMGLFALLYLGLELLVTRSFLNEVYLIVFSYVILGSFVGTELVLALDPVRKSAVSGAWSTIFFIYLTYTFLPLHVRESSICGCLLGVAQLACALSLNTDDPNLSRQVSFLKLPKCQHATRDVMGHCTCS